MALSTKVFQPVDRLVFRPRADGNRNVDWNSAPLKVGGSKIKFALSAASIPEEDFCRQAPADELLAWIHRAVFINAAMCATLNGQGCPEKRRAADIDLQPAVATGRAFRNVLATFD